MRRFIWLVLLVAGLTLGALPTFAEENQPRAWLGVRLGGSAPPPVKATEDTPEAPGPTGVKITGVFQESPADRGGLRAQDRIVAVEGTVVTSAADLIRRVRESESGAWVTLDVLRGDDELELRVRLAEKQRKGSQVRKGWIGVWVVDLTPQLQEHFGAPEKTGVMIGVIREGSPAFDAGFELGDVVYQIDGEPIRSEKEFMRRVFEAGVGNRVEFTTMRDGVEVVLEALIEVQPQRRGDR